MLVLQCTVRIVLCKAIHGFRIPPTSYSCKMESKTTSSSEVESEDLFRTSFKTFKSVKNFQQLFPSGSSDGRSEDEAILLDPSCDREGKSKLTQRKLNLSDTDTCECESFFGLRPPRTWKVYEFEFPKGLILIRNPFTRKGQRYWIRRSIIDFPTHPFITNIDNLENKEGKRIKANLTEEDFYKKLRWVTFGYHHNWDTKVYSEDSKSQFPEDLADLTNLMAKVLGFSDFKAEAAIANYYHLDSTLSGHVDRSEVNQQAPLFSLSFGQPAVFLIGGRTKSVKPKAVLLRSGDVAVMSGESRLSYHGVPKIIHSSDEPWNTEDVLPYDKEHEDETICSKKPKLEIDVASLSGESKISTLCKTCERLRNSYSSLEKNVDSFNLSECEWDAFLKSYVSKSRINLNIRQVLFHGQTHLSDSIC